MSAISNLFNKKRTYTVIDDKTDSVANSEPKPKKKTELKDKLESIDESVKALQKNIKKMGCVNYVRGDIHEVVSGEEDGVECLGTAKIYGENSIVSFHCALEETNSEMKDSSRRVCKKLEHFKGRFEKVDEKLETLLEDREISENNLERIEETMDDFIEKASKNDVEVMGWKQDIKKISQSCNDTYSKLYSIEKRISDMLSQKYEMKSDTPNKIEEIIQEAVDNFLRDIERIYEIEENIEITKCNTIEIKKSVKKINEDVGALKDVSSQIEKHIKENEGSYKKVIEEMEDMNTALLNLKETVDEQECGNCEDHVEKLVKRIGSFEGRVEILEAIGENVVDIKKALTGGESWISKNLVDRIGGFEDRVDVLETIGEDVVEIKEALREREGCDVERLAERIGEFEDRIEILETIGEDVSEIKQMLRDMQEYSC